MFTMKKCMAVMFTFLFLASSTLALADEEEARSEEFRVETSEELLSVEPAASPEAMAFVQATTLPEDDEWHFIAAPYLWVVDTAGTIKIGPIVQEIDLPFSAILSQLQGAFILHFEANKKRWGAATDFSYVSAAKGGALQIPLPGGSTASGDLGIKLLFWEAWPYYRLGEGASVFDIIGGIRYYRISTEFDFSQIGGQTRDLSIDWVDPIVGGRWIGQVHPKVRLTARADFGGFGAGAELTTNLQGGVAVLLREKFLLLFQYRWMDIDYNQGDAPLNRNFFEYKATSQGALIGFGFAF
jgi:hypothetical protein